MKNQFLKFFFAASLLFFTIGAKAQSYIGTLDMTEAEFNQIVAQTPLGGTMVSQNAAGVFQVVNGGGTYQPPTWPPFPPCTDQLTPTVAANALAAANACCCPVWGCFRRDDCNFYAVVWYPNNGCGVVATPVSTTTVPVYQ